MSRRRPPVLLFESNRGRDLRLFSSLAWLLVIGMAVTLWLSLAEQVPGGDSPTMLFLGQMVLLLVAVMTDRARRRTVARVYRLPEGLIFEMMGLAGPFRRHVAAAELGAVKVIPPDIHGRMVVRLPDRGPPLVLHTGVGGLDLGLPPPPGRGKRKR